MRGRLSVAGLGFSFGPGWFAGTSEAEGDGEPGLSLLSFLDGDGGVSGCRVDGRNRGY